MRNDITQRTRKITKKIQSLEAILEIESDQNFYILLRRKKKWILESIGTPITVIVQGKPSYNEIASIMASDVVGPFTTRIEAQSHLKEELKKMRREDPERFRQLEESREFALWPAEYEKFRRPIVPQNRDLKE